MRRQHVPIYCTDHAKPNVYTLTWRTIWQTMVILSEVLIYLKGFIENRAEK